MKQTMTCAVRLANGQPCGQPAALFNADYTEVVCLQHATHLSDEQRQLLRQVLGTLGKALEPTTRGAGRRLRARQISSSRVAR
jgi:hypothetical protein